MLASLRARRTFFAILAIVLGLQCLYGHDKTLSVAELEKEIDRRLASSSIDEIVRLQPKTPTSPRDAVLAFLVYQRAERTDLQEGTFDSLVRWSDEIGLDNLGELALRLLYDKQDTLRRYFERVPQCSEIAATLFLSEWKESASIKEIDAWLEKQYARDPFWLEMRFWFAAENHYLAALVPAYKAAIEKDPSNVQAIKEFAVSFHQDRCHPVSIDWLLQYKPPKATDCLIIGWALKGREPKIAVAFLERALELPLTEPEIQEEIALAASLGRPPMFSDPEKNFRWGVRSYLVQALGLAGRSEEAWKLEAELDAEAPPVQVTQEPPDT